MDKDNFMSHDSGGGFSHHASAHHGSAAHHHHQHHHADGSAPYLGALDRLADRAMNDPGIRRGLRIGGRVLGIYAIVGALIFLAALVFIIIVAVQVFTSSDSPDGFNSLRGAIMLPLSARWT